MLEKAPSETVKIGLEVLSLLKMSLFHFFLKKKEKTVNLFSSLVSFYSLDVYVLLITIDLGCHGINIELVSQHLN